MLILLASLSQAADIDVLAGGAVSLMGWQRSADYAAMVSFTGLAAVRTSTRLGATFEGLVAHSREQNSVLTQTSLPVRLSTTLDVTLRRGGVGFSAGLGPGVALLSGTTRDAETSWTGLTVSPALRTLVSVDSTIYRSLAWRLHGGVTVRRGGVDADLGAGLVVRWRAL